MFLFRKNDRLLLEFAKERFKIVVNYKQKLLLIFDELTKKFLFWNRGGEEIYTVTKKDFNEFFPRESINFIEEQYLEDMK